ncbi:hypothetical protein JB92DRAFT_3292218 [Gautieria morchelliformis]|nr:hypothetical protein JB92DRAFT_3292218 [Gautieria morchelliformis]
MSTRNEVMLEGSRKSISSYMQMILRDWIKMQWFRGCLLTAPALAVVICPLGSPHSQPSSARTHVEVVRVLSGPQKQGVYDPHGEEGLRHEGGQHAPLRHVFILWWRQTPTTTSDFEVSLKDRHRGEEINIGSIHHLCVISALMILLSMPFRSCLRLSSPFLAILRLGIQLEKILLKPLPRLRSRLQLAHPDVSHVLILHTQHYTLNVSVGLAKGCEFVFEGEGDESPDWEAGNIIIHVLDGKKKGD